MRGGLSRDGWLRGNRPIFDHRMKFTDLRGATGPASMATNQIVLIDSSCQMAPQPVRRHGDGGVAPVCLFTG